MNRIQLSSRRRALRIAALAVALGASARAQTLFSVDFRGPTVGSPSCAFGPPIAPHDLLVPCTGTLNPMPGPLPPPRVMMPGGPGGVGIPGPADLDALSRGFDGPALPAMPPGSFWFSVTRTSVGMPTPAAPNVNSETPAPVSEGAADLFIDIGLPAGPVPPAIGGNTETVDGNGLPPPGVLGYPGLGVVEPHGGCIGAILDPGDNLDALDLDTPAMPVIPPVFFSVDSPVPDVCGTPSMGGPYLPGAIMMGGPGVLVPLVWAPPVALGLDFAGAGTDNLDALAIFENGVAGFQPSPVPYAWLGGGTDMVLFSVSANSVVVGAPDSMFGLPIQPGDILMPPVAGGLSPFPGIFVAAENLGLVTARMLPVVPDDLDALDVVRAPLFDCNGNGREDALDIALGGAPDCNGNGVPDGCESNVSAYCPTGVTSNGCTPTMNWAGTPTASLTCPFVVGVNNVEGQKSGIIFYGITGPALGPWGCGGSFLCVKAPTQRTPAQMSGGTAGACDGVLMLNFVAYMTTHPTALGQPLFAGESFSMQAWFRDPPCGKATTHMSQALRFTLAP
ncbi:MAG: hypothetical protein IT454_09455 [Planctomycetes bacterium]|nr:hypothetical protein [Planctomycetota bacterium]